MYHSFLPIHKTNSSAFRIFSPLAYSAVRDAWIVPIGLQEATQLAKTYPIVWVPDLAGRQHASVLLRPGPVKRKDANSSRTPPSLLPDILKAYPLRLRHFEASDYEIGIDHIMPEQETDAGSYVYDPHGELTPGAKLKLSALNRFSEDQSILSHLKNRLLKYSSFEPVILPEDFSAEANLPSMYAAPEALDLLPIVAGLPERYVQIAIGFLVAQRMSLYRMYGLLRR